MSPAALSLLENEHSKGIDFISGLRLATVLRMDPYSLGFGDDSDKHQPQTTVYTPIIGETNQGPPDSWFDNGCPVHGYADDVVCISVANASKAYALRVSEAAGSMQKGDIILLDPDSTAESGDDVLVLTADASVPKVMQMMFFKADNYHLKNYDDEQVTTVSKNDIAYLHPIVAKVSQAMATRDPVAKSK
ncbi:MAG: hypothetical protein SwStaBPW_28410 [Shewanella algae]